MIRRCATCWNKRGDISSNWICRRCRAQKCNRGWVAPSRLEAGGFDVDTMQAGSSIKLGTRRDSYAGELAIEIMKLFCFGVHQRGIARNLGCAVSYVNKTIRFWQKNRRENLKLIIEMVRLSVKHAH